MASVRITKDTELVVGMRFYNRGGRDFPALVGVPCRITGVVGSTVHYRSRQDGTGERYEASRDLFVSSGHCVLRTGDVTQPPVEL